MDTQELLTRFAVALGIGLLIGVERGWRTREDVGGSRTAGIRTFSISGLLGGVIGAMAVAAGGAASVAGALILAFSFTAYAGAITAFSLEENRSEKTFSATTAIAAILAFSLSAYALVGDVTTAAAIAVCATLVLALREVLHGWLRSLTWQELRSGLILLAMTFIVLPVLPSDQIGPFGGVNPREILLIAIVLAGVSFVGYIAVKYLGERLGLLLAAASGGLVSSTAVMLANAKRASAGEGSPQMLAAGASLATAVSFLRALAIVGALRPELLAIVAPPLAAAILVAAGLAVIWAYSPHGQPQTEITLRNPFDFWTVIVMAASMGVFILLGRLLNQAFGARGAIAGAATLGLFDIDAVIVSVTQLVPQSLTIGSGAYAILAAVASNTLSKLVLGAVIGRGWFAINVAVMSICCLGAGLVGLWFAIELSRSAE